MLVTLMFDFINLILTVNEVKLRSRYKYHDSQFFNLNQIDTLKIFAKFISTNVAKIYAVLFRNFFFKLPFLFLRFTVP